MHPIKIIKASGKPEVFSGEKLRRSLKRSGAGNEIISAIVEEISASLKEGMTARQIYRQAFDLLKQYAAPLAARYKLKQAVNELGPSGFPFELFVAALLKQQGYSVQTGVLVEGHCVKHEIDVIAEKDERHFMVECKFHNKQGIYSDVKIPLYIQSRFLDVERKWKELAGHEARFHQAWIYTNTRFTTDALAYSSCMGINLVGWDQPETFSLKKQIDDSGLHPVTSLTTLTAEEKRRLLAQRIVLCKDICLHPDSLQQLGITDNTRLKTILAEGKSLCESVVA